jgi:hypothetical protein
VQVASSGVPFLYVPLNSRAAALTCTAPLLLLTMGYDYWSRGKVHRATIWGGLFVVALQQVRDPLGCLAGVCLVDTNPCAFPAHLGVGGNGKINGIGRRKFR